MDKQGQRPLAVVTGASSGIGRELAKQFAEHGYDVLITAEDDAISIVAQELTTAESRVESVQADLRNYEGVEDIFKRIKSMGRPVDAIAINAGVGVYGDFARDSELDRELDLIDLNISSSVHIAKRVLKDMVAQGKGKILFTSSVVSAMPGPLSAVYAASKAFLQSFAEAIRAELHDTGVTVTALLPGATDTNFFKRAGMQNTKVGQAKKDDPAKVARQGFDALMSGKDQVVAGSLMNKIQVAAARVIPEPIKARIHMKETAPETKKRKAA